MILIRAGVTPFELSPEGQMGVGQVDRRGMVVESSREAVTCRKTSMYKDMAGGRPGALGEVPHGA